MLDTECLKKFLRYAKKRGVKAILYSGEGEPLLHKDIIDITAFTKQLGFDVALSTNGVMLNKDRADKILKCLTWLRMDVDAATEDTYSFIHKADKGDFQWLINNIKDTVKIKKQNRLECIINVQFLLIPQNYKEVIKLARMMKIIGVDQLIIKPHCYHPLSKNKIDANFPQADLLWLEKKLEKYADDNFNVIFCYRMMKKNKEQKPYSFCFGFAFAAHITARGDIYPCNAFVGKKEFSFGNICKKNFRDIWEGKKRKNIVKKIRNNWDVENCRNSCRLDEMNRYLWELKNPGKHVNFI